MEEYSLLVAYDTDGNEIQGKMKIVIKFIISVHILSFYLFMCNINESHVITSTSY